MPPQGLVAERDEPELRDRPRQSSFTGCVVDPPSADLAHIRSCGFERRDLLVQAGVEHREQQVRFAVEVGVDGASSESGVGGDLVEARSRVPVVGEVPTRRFHQGGAGLLLLLSASHVAALDLTTELRYTVYVNAGRARKRSKTLAIGLLASWLAVNVLSAYAAANPWVTELVWRPPDRTGALAAAVPGVEIDTARVVGWHLPPRNDLGTVVLVHGYGDDRNAPPAVTAAGWLHDAGYGVLAIDLGYLHGRHRYTAGHREAADISAAVDWLAERDEPTAGVWGFSAGAHAALVAASRDHRIPAVIADSAFVDGGTQIRRIAAATWKLPESSFLVTAAAVDVFSGDRPVDLRATPWSGTPTLIIHGEADDAVPYSNANTIRQHTDGTLIALPGVGHIEAHTAAAERYRTAVLALLNSTGSADAPLAPHPETASDAPS